MIFLSGSFDVEIWLEILLEIWVPQSLTQVPSFDKFLPRGIMGQMGK